MNFVAIIAALALLGLGVWLWFRQARRGESPAGASAPDPEDGSAPAPGQMARNEAARAIQGVRTLLWAILSAGGLGIVVFSFKNGYDAGACDTFSVGLLTAGAALLSGGLVGFLFGIPRSLQHDERKPSGGSGEVSAGRPGGVRFSDNTNLEQISDWLTKIIVGVGLTQLYRVPGRVGELVDFVSRAGGFPNKAFVLGLLVYFVAAGFIFGYLLTRMYLPTAFSLVANEVQRLEGQFGDLRAAMKEGVGGKTLRPRHGDRSPATPLSSEGVTSPDDPQKGLWGGLSRGNGRELTARIEEIPYHSDWFVVRLVVRPDARALPLTEPVTFHLHPSFDPPTREVAPESGRATLDLRAWGAFTVGVEADGGNTRLELDLAAIPDAPALFRSR